MTSSICFVDSPEAADAARRLGHAALVTDNPLLARSVPGVVDASTLLGQQEGTRLGEAVIDALLAIDQALLDSDVVAQFGLWTPRLNVTLPMRSVAVTLCHRGAMAARALAQVDAQAPVHIVSVPGPSRDPDSPWLLSRFACPLPVLADSGFFGERRVTAQHVVRDLPLNPNDQTTDDLVSRILVTPTPMLAEEFLLRLAGNRLRGRKLLHVVKLSESLRETLPWLRMRGYGIKPLKLPGYATARANEPLTVAPFVAALAQPILERAFTQLGIFANHQADAIIAIMLGHLSAGLTATGQMLERLGVVLDGVAATGGKAAILTSGIYGPLGTHLHAGCRSRGIAVIDFEHGATTGIARSSQRRLGVSEATTSDLLVASSPRAARAFGEAGGAVAVAVGLPDQTRQILRAPVQRWWARRRLGLPPGESVLLHVSGLLYGGNMRPGDDAPVEMHIDRTERTLLGSVYSGLAHTVLYKPYPAIRLPYQPALEELHGLSANVRIAAREDFRYMRAAADIIVTDANTSTIGWCAGADTPLVHLNSRHVNALVDEELRQGFAEAFFCIDMDRPDWADTLRALLELPLAEVRSQWRDKARFRAAFLEEALFGPRGCFGRRAAGTIDTFLARRTSHADR